MKKSLYFAMALLTFSLVACGTQNIPEIQTPEIENGKEDVTETPSEENVIPEMTPEATATPEPTPEPTATPVPTPEPKDLIDEDDTALELLKNTLGNIEYLKTRSFGMSEYYIDSETDVEISKGYSFDDTGKTRESVSFENNILNTEVSTERWVEPSGNEFTVYDYAYDNKQGEVTSATENPVNHLQWLSNIPFEDFEYYIFVSPGVGAYTSVHITVKELEDKLGLSFSQLLEKAGGDKEAIANFPVLLKFHFNETKDLYLATAAVLTDDIEDDNFKNIEDCYFELRFIERTAEYPTYVNIPYQFFEEDNYGDLSRYPAEPDLDFDYREVLDASLGNEEWRNSGTINVRYNYTDADRVVTVVRTCTVNDGVMKVEENFDSEVYYEEEEHTTSTYFVEKKENSYVVYEDGAEPKELDADPTGIFDLLDKSYYFKPIYRVGERYFYELETQKSLDDIKYYYNFDIKRLFDGLNKAPVTVKSADLADATLKISIEEHAFSGMTFDLYIPVSGDYSYLNPRVLIYVDFVDMGTPVEVTLP